MKDTCVKKVFEVWEAKNRIFEPSNKTIALDIVDQVASLFSPGDFYYYVLNFVTFKMDFVSEGVKTVLGITPNEFTLEKVFSLFHPDDLNDLHKKEKASIDFKIDVLSTEEITKYKTVYLIRMILDNGEEKTILHQSRAINISEDGKVQQVMGVHTDISHLNLPIDHKVSFIGHRLPNYYFNNTTGSFDLLDDIKSIFTKREKEVLTEITKGKTTNTIANALHISPHTVSTHKKNILKKTNCKSLTELITKCIKEGIV